MSTTVRILQNMFQDCLENIENSKSGFSFSWSPIILAGIVDSSVTNIFYGFKIIFIAL